MGLDLGAKREENERALRRYDWTSRTEVQVKGRTRRTMIHRVSHDASGAPVRTLVSEEGGEKKPGLRGKIQQKKQEEFRDWAEELGALLQQYVQADPERMQAFFKTATFEAGADELAGSVRLRGRDFVVPGDDVSFWMDTATQKPRRIEIHTVLEDEPVHLTVEFAAVPDGGPSYPARALVEAPAKQVRMTVENSELVRKAP